MNEVMIANFILYIKEKLYQDEGWRSNVEEEGT